MIDKNARIYVAGHRGLVGSALVRNLREKGYANILTRTHAELDLTDQRAVGAFFAEEKPEYVLLAAAKVGGIWANLNERADFIYENLMIASNVIHASWRCGVKKLLFLGSTCIYPRMAPQPMKEDELLAGPLEYTNEPYAVAKIAGMKMCESYNIQYGTDFISVMPTNLYGINDNFDLNGGHVLPSVLRKLHLAKLLEERDFSGISRDFRRFPIDRESGGCMDDPIEDTLRDHGISKKDGRVVLTLWGTGTPLREFMSSDDMADASVFLLENAGWKELSAGKAEKRNCHVNIGTGEELSIRGLAELAAGIVGFRGEIRFDAGKPDGTPRKLTDTALLRSLGWTPKVTLPEGIRKMYEWYLNEIG